MGGLWGEAHIALKSKFLARDKGKEKADSSGAQTKKKSPTWRRGDYFGEVKKVILFKKRGKGLGGGVFWGW